MELIQDGEIVSAGSLTLPMSDDFEWGVDLFRQASDPLEVCIGWLRGPQLPCCRRGSE